MSMSDESASTAPGRGGPSRGPARAAPSRSTTDEIQERYLKRAVAEIGELGDELHALGDELHVPVLGSGHPLGDVFLLKHRPTQSEIHEGVAFYGRAGQALLKSLQRLSVDPLAVYGTNCLKFGTEDESEARGWLTRELHIVQPKLVVAMGDETVAFLARLAFPLAEELDAGRMGELQRFTPTIEALVTPDIDASLDEQAAKTRFWQAFKELGAWWAEQPPY
jgi:uracil-DNA glycosylase family 4